MPRRLSNEPAGGAASARDAALLADNARWQGSTIHTLCGESAFEAVFPYAVACVGAGEMDGSLAASRAAGRTRKLWNGTWHS